MTSSELPGLVLALPKGRILKELAPVLALVATWAPSVHDGGFVELQHRITDAEEAVASARQFYNDAVNVLRDRRSTFPGRLFAWSVTIPSWELFEAADARQAPLVAIDPTPAPPVPDGGRPGA